MNQVLFHLAFPVNDIAKTKEFYSNGLGCEVGRESRNSVILNLYGNQIVAHVAKETLEPQKGIYPRHFGLVFSLESDWETLLERAQKNKLKFNPSLYSNIVFVLLLGRSRAQTFFPSTSKLLTAAGGIDGPHAKSLYIFCSDP